MPAWRWAYLKALSQLEGGRGRKSQEFGPGNGTGAGAGEGGKEHKGGSFNRKGGRKVPRSFETPLTTPHNALEEN